MNDDKITGYSLSRHWFDYAFENPDMVTPNHTALYFWTIELCNRLGWKEKFGLPTVHSMEAMGLKSYNTYKKTLMDLIRWGFIILVSKSSNQYTSNIIALSNFDKAQYKALDKALTKHSTKQNDIYKQINKETIKPVMSETFSPDYKPDGIFDSLSFQLWKIAYDNKAGKGIKATTLLKAKPATWAKEIRLCIEADNRTEAEILEVLNFLRHDTFWINNVESPAKLRKQFERLQLEAKTPKKKTGNSYAVGQDYNINSDFTKTLHDGDTNK